MITVQRYCTQGVPRRSIISRRSFPESPWQSGMPPFGLFQQPFIAMMEGGPMWLPQNNLPFMAGSMLPDMMRFGGNVPSRPSFRRTFDQMPGRYKPPQACGGFYGHRQGGHGRGDRKRPGGHVRMRSHSSKRAALRRDGGRKADEDHLKKGAASEQRRSVTDEEAAEHAAAHRDIYGPVEPITADAVKGADVECAQDDSGEAAQEGSNEDCDQEPGRSADKDETGGGEGGASASAAISGRKLPAEPATTAPVPEAAETNTPSKAADGKGQAGGRPSEKGREEKGTKRSDQKDKGGAQFARFTLMAASSTTGGLKITR
ncbi:hypothetical protein HPB50_020013 [Hyalomma asiaticum]|uniref:Uncharacterized protein n=1 Tax=Hyalomma asiaticum TaxID=266040 RepID=A0ACB7RKA3_HYAAI|nr:hypothetical protein HPB50_020013 [Hyalomma asiaticum]